MLLRCPKCKQTMQYQPMMHHAKTRRKRCVYCGTSFKAEDNIAKTI